MGAYEADYTLGPIVFCLYFTVMFFIIMNVLLGYETAQARTVHRGTRHVSFKALSGGGHWGCTAVGVPANSLYGTLFH